MNKKTLPDNFQSKLDEWFKGYEYEIVHVWNDSLNPDTYQVVILMEDDEVEYKNDVKTHVLCIRLFETFYQSGMVSLSVDKEHTIE